MAFERGTFTEEFEREGRGRQLGCSRRDRQVQGRARPSPLVRLIPGNVPAESLPPQ